LFLASNAAGAFRAEEIFDFCQDDLDESKSMILDCGHSIFVWEGLSPTKDEKKDTLQYTLDYVKNHPDERSTKANWENQNFLIKARKEPLCFTAYFFGWDSPNWTPYKEPLDLVYLTLQEYSRVYTLEELLKRPKTVDLTCLESYLSDEEFQKLFKCSKQEFQKMPDWKRVNLKKVHGLY